MPEWLQSILLGVVEGITEFLPISSTGHLIIVQYFMDDLRSEFFNVGIQSGAVLAVVLIYREKLQDLCLNWRKSENLDYILKCGTAFVITAVLGWLSRKCGLELPETLAPVAWAVLTGALLIFLAEYWLRHHQALEIISWKVAAFVGMAQVLAAVFPGTSRSAATIIAAMLLGSSRMAATEFSFLVGIPTMFAAGGYALISEIKDQGGIPSSELDQFSLGFLVSTVTAFIAVKWLLGFLRSHNFIPFAWYRLALGLALLLWLAVGGH